MTGCGVWGKLQDVHAPYNEELYNMLDRDYQHGNGPDKEPWFGRFTSQMEDKCGSMPGALKCSSWCHPFYAGISPASAPQKRRQVMRPRPRPPAEPAPPPPARARARGRPRF